jgi:hypothetical protein
MVHIPHHHAPSLELGGFKFVGLFLGKAKQAKLNCGIQKRASQRDRKVKSTTVTT